MPLGEEVEQQPPLLGSNKCPTKSLRATDFQRTHAASNPVTLPECAVLKLRARPNGSARRVTGEQAVATSFSSWSWLLLLLPLSVLRLHTCILQVPQQRARAFFAKASVCV